MNLSSHVQTVAYLIMHYVWLYASHVFGNAEVAVCCYHFYVEVRLSLL